MKYEENYERHARLWEYAEDCYMGSERIKNGPNAESYLPLQSLEREELRSGRCLLYTSPSPRDS